MKISRTEGRDNLEVRLFSLSFLDSFYLWDSNVCYKCSFRQYQKHRRLFASSQYVYWRACVRWGTSNNTVTRTALCVCSWVSTPARTWPFSLSVTTTTSTSEILSPVKPVDNAGSFPGYIDSPRVNQTTRSHLQSRKEGADIYLHSPTCSGCGGLTTESIRLI